MTASIRPISPPRETLDFDHDRLSALCAAHGPGAEAEIARILGRIETGLLATADLFAAGDAAGLRAEAETLIALGRRIGLRNVEAAARAVRDGVDRADRAGLAACVGRLARLAEPDPAPDWEIETDDAG